MKLAAAILCLDCDELHESPRKCPACASEAPGFPVRRAIASLAGPEVTDYVQRSYDQAMDATVVEVYDHATGAREVEVWPAKEEA